MIQSGQNFAHVTTAKLSWHVQNCGLVGSIEWKLQQKEYSQDFYSELISICIMDPWPNTMVQTKLKFFMDIS